MTTVRVQSALLALAIACAVPACGGDALSESRALFARGHYPAAKQALLAIDPRELAGDVQERAQYALYRALTHGALGDLAARDRWLDEAASIASACPDALDEQDQARLRIARDQQAWDTLRR